MCATSMPRRFLPTFSVAACRPPLPGSARNPRAVLFRLCLPWGFSDTGIFGIHAATGAEDMSELVPVILGELRKASDNIREDEINRARAQIRAQLMMGQESPAARAGQIARQMMLYGRPISNTELMERLSGITTERLTDLSGGSSSTRSRRSRPSGRWRSLHRCRTSRRHLRITSPNRSRRKAARAGLGKRRPDQQNLLGVRSHRCRGPCSVFSRVRTAW